jgi:ATP-dependent DNA ligase
MPHRRNWVKVKRWLDGTFECVGYTLGCGKRERLFGALIVRSLDGKLKAEVGTGFDDATLVSLLEYMRGRSKEMILVGGAMPAPVGVWVEPFKVHVKYVEVTNAGSLRFPVYLGRDASS